MYKLMILVPTDIDEPQLKEGWPQFLHTAESMPGLQREASVRVAAALYGQQAFSMIHEFYFETLADLQDAMVSPEGLATGQIIQQLTDGQMTLLIAEHREDDIENLRQYKNDG